MGRIGPGQTSMAMCSWMEMAKRFPFRTVIALQGGRQLPPRGARRSPLNNELLAAGRPGRRTSPWLITAPQTAHQPE
ncbi:hypothetical protein EYF80_025624 [Liparis tanakae]|uniref:Uncharacterized protein n=1 Tax=Liparis tanakae TaxID=230148 RepID=A0A4Z2HEI4_9TELE|nr:hypothetical protein EYF80_025624 [Liparis tanakae]